MRLFLDAMCIFVYDYIGRGLFFPGRGMSDLRLQKSKQPHKLQTFLHFAELFWLVYRVRTTGHFLSGRLKDFLRLKSSVEMSVKWDGWCSRIY